jgi:hypothetical protein
VPLFLSGKKGRPIALISMHPGGRPRAMKLQNSQVNMRGHVNSARSLAPAFSAGCFLSVCVAVSQRKEGPAHCIDFYASTLLRGCS